MPNIENGCRKCGLEFTEDDIDYAKSGGTNPETGEISPIGDYDFVCYPCQFELMESGEWEDFVESKGLVFD